MPYNSTCAQTLRAYEASCHCNWDSRLDCVDHSCSFRSKPPRLGRLDSFFDRDSSMLWLQFPAQLGHRPVRFSPTSIVLSRGSLFLNSPWLNLRWRHFGDIAHHDSFIFTYLTHHPHDHLTWTGEIHSTHISSGSEDSNTCGSPDFYEAMTTLAYLAGLVRSVRLGVACLVVPCRNPLLT